MTVFFFFLLVLETVILGRVMKNLAAGRGRKEEDSGNRLGTLLLRRPWTWGENVEPSERSVKMLSVWRAVSFALVSILTQTCPPRQTHSDSDYLFLLALVRGQIPNSFVLCYFGQWATFPCIPTAGFPRTYLRKVCRSLPLWWRVGEHRAPRKCGCGAGTGRRVQPLGTVLHMTHPPCFLVFSMEEFQELLASPLSSWESQISSFPYFATIFMGVMLRS